MKEKESRRGRSGESRWSARREEKRVGRDLACLGGGLQKRDLEIGVQVVGLGRNLRSLAGGGATAACRRRTDFSQTVNAVLCLVSLRLIFRERQGKSIKIRDEVSRIEKGPEGVRMQE
jgi:hypothetical protein